MTTSLLKSCRLQSKLYKKFIKLKSKSSEIKFKARRNLLKTLIKEAEKDFYTKKLINVNNDNRHLWKLINEILRNKINLVESFLDRNNEIVDMESTAIKFNLAAKMSIADKKL